MILAIWRAKQAPDADGPDRKGDGPFGGWAHFSGEIFLLPKCIVRTSGTSHYSLAPLPLQAKAKHIKLYMMVHVFLILK